MTACLKPQDELSQEESRKGICMGNSNYRQEIDEAIRAGNRARYSLFQAKDCLKSAGNWGLVDIIGGGLFVTFVKRSRMKDAERLVQQARNDLMQFRKELADVSAIAEFHIETGNFLAFADYFLDCFVTDLLVQSKIQDAKKQVDDAIEKVERVLQQLGDL